MAVFQKSFRISTRGHCDLLDITDRVNAVVAESGRRGGIVNVSSRVRSKRSRR